MKKMVDDQQCYSSDKRATFYWLFVWCWCWSESVHYNMVLWT